MSYGIPLSCMSDAAIDAAYEAYTERLWESQFDETLCCKYCTQHDGKYCERLLDKIPEGEEENEEYLREAERDDDDYCDHYDKREPDYPSWMDGESDYE